MPDPQPPDRSELRASDADRDRVAEELREALAEGRLTPDEHSERIDAVYAAKTYADLEPVVADLPVPESGRPLSPATGGRLAGGAPDLPPPSAVPPSIVAVFGGAKRDGRWLVPFNTTVTAVFGGVEFDFRQAVLSQREVTITVTAIFGGVEMKVPPGVRVVSSVTGIFGGTSVPPDDTDDLDAPVIRLNGFALFGGVDAQRSPNAVGRVVSRWSEIRERRREARELRREGREERRLRREGG